MAEPEHCDLCPFAGCVWCRYQPEMDGQPDLLDELEDEEP